MLRNFFGDREVGGSDEIHLNCLLLYSFFNFLRLNPEQWQQE